MKTAMMALMLALAMVAPLGLSARAVPATPVADPMPGEAAVGSLTTADGRERTYRIYVPSTYDPSDPVPLVLVFHGTGGSGEQVARDTGFDASAEANGFLAVYPDGTAGPNGILTWNADHCCGYAEAANVDDVAFIDELIDHLEEEYAIDPDRIYAAGMSNGGMFTYRLACGLTDRIAAIASVSGTGSLQDCDPGRPIPVLHMHGTADEIIPVAGGTVPDGAQPSVLPPVTDTIEFWRRFDGCTRVPERAVDGPLTIETYDGCDDDSEVIFYIIQNGGHAWPGGGRVQDRLPADLELDATDVIWDFFAAHPMP